MTVSTQDPETREVPPSPLVLAGDVEIDIQVTTARAYPRSLTDFIRRATEMATLNKEIAASCIYALPRKEDGEDKMIEGPSARLAEIIANAWKNCRFEGKVVDEDDRFVTARGTFWDIEANTAVAYEVRRRITNRKGRKYSDDMVGVTGNAAASIAIRNAIFKGVPSPFWLPIYRAVRKTIAGEAETFQNRRANMLHEFGVMGVTKDVVAARLGLKGWQDITLDHMVSLTGLLNALRDGEISIEEAFDMGASKVPPQPAQRTAQTADAGASAQRAGEQTSSEGETRNPREMSSQTSGAVDGAPPPADTKTPTYIGTVANIEDRKNGVFLITLSTGFRCATKNGELVEALQAHRAHGRTVELGTRKTSTAGAAPILEEVIEQKNGGGQ